MVDLIKLSVTDLAAFLNAELCHIESQTSLSIDNSHTANIRDGIAVLERLALQGKFNILTHGREGNYKLFADGLKDNSKLIPAER